MNSIDLDASRDEALLELEKRLPAGNDDPRVRADAERKRNRLRSWLAAQQLDGVLISRRDNFSWLTVGGDNHVLKNTEVGVSHALITPDHQYLLANTMDGERQLAEEVPGQGYELVTARWYEADPREKAFELGGKRIAADTPLAGAEERGLELSRLHEPLTPLELDRCRWIARQSSLLLGALARWVRPGMSENEIARQTRAVYSWMGFDLDVVLTGSDERIGRYWHAMPSDKKVQRFMLLHPAARRWGLHANINRFISFGEPPEAVRKAHSAALTIQARVLGMLKPGVPFSQILEKQKDWYHELGYPGEWELHYQGGPTGYVVGDATRCWTPMKIVANQAYDWFITVRGVQVEELSLLTEAGIELASLGKDWPLKTIHTEQGEIVVPDMFIA